MKENGKKPTDIEGYLDEAWDKACSDVESAEARVKSLKERCEELEGVKAHLLDLRLIATEVDKLIGDALEHLKLLNDPKLQLWFRKRIMESLGFEGVRVTDGVKLTLKSGAKVLVGQTHAKDLALVGTVPTIHISDDGITLKEESDNSNGNGMAEEAVAKTEATDYLRKKVVETIEGKVTVKAFPGTFNVPEEGVVSTHIIRVEDLPKHYWENSDDLYIAVEDGNVVMTDPNLAISYHIIERADRDAVEIPLLPSIDPEKAFEKICTAIPKMVDFRFQCQREDIKNYCTVCSKERECGIPTKAEQGIPPSEWKWVYALDEEGIPQWQSRCSEFVQQTAVPDYYMPSNGSEGTAFTRKFCDRCNRCPVDPDSQNQCDILVDALSGIQRPEWVQVDGEPTCTAFVERPEIDGDAIAKLEESRCSSCAKHPQFGGDCQILTEMKASQKQAPDVQKTDDVWFCSSYDHLDIEDEDDDIEEGDIESNDPVYPHPVGSDLEGALSDTEDEDWQDGTWPGPEPEPEQEPEPESESESKPEFEPEPEPEFTPGNDPRTKYRELREANRNILLNSKSSNKSKPGDEENVEGVPIYRSGDRVEFPKDSGAAPGLGKLEPALEPRQQLTREQREVDKEINDYAWSLLPIHCSAISVNLVLKKYPHGMDSLRRGESLYRRFKLRNWDGSSGEECIQWDSPKVPTPVIVKPSAEDVHDRIEREKREKWESLTLPTAVDVLVKFRLRLEEAQKAGKKNISWKQFINDWDNCDEGPVGDRVFECLKFLREKRRLHFNDGGRTIKGGEWYDRDIPADQLPPELMTLKWRDPETPTEETPTEETSTEETPTEETPTEETSTEETSTEETSTEETSTEETSVKPKLKAGDIVRYLNADWRIVIIDYASRAKIEPVSGGKPRRVPVAYLKPKTSDTSVK